MILSITLNPILCLVSIYFFPLLPNPAIKYIFYFFSEDSSSLVFCSSLFSVASVDHHLSSSDFSSVASAETNADGARILATVKSLSVIVGFIAGSI